MAAVRPMLATLASDSPESELRNPSLVYEPKYDGIRALVAIEPDGGVPTVTIRSRVGNDKTAQFPELVRELQAFGRRFRAPVLIDGEIVALGPDGEPVGFQQIQGRIHLSTAREIALESARQPVAFIAFDLLRDGPDDFRPVPLVTRRARLERLFGNAASPLVRLSEFEAGDASALYERARTRGWEGLIAKEAHSLYDAGRRSRAWRKLKLLRRQEFVIGGWTEPRQTRAFFGALLLGYYEGDGPTRRLVYAGHTGAGFTQGELERLWRKLKPLETSSCPFAVRPRTNERPHWVEPRLVAEVKFTEWTNDGKLRQPVYLGLRDDVAPESVRREPDRVLPGHDPRARGGTRAAAPGEDVAPSAASGSGERSRPSTKPVVVSSRAVRRGQSDHAPASASVPAETQQHIDRLVEELRALEDARRDGMLQLPGGHTLEITNLHKVFWPGPRFTKGDLFRYYVAISPWLLPVVEDRPLVMKRFPNGVTGKAFYQQRAPDTVPAGVRVEVVPWDADDESPASGRANGRSSRSRGDDDESPPRLIGGSLTTLLYMTQIAAISQDPWFSRVGSPGFADYVAIDLDPMPGVPFSQVLDVARWVRDELDRLGVEGFPKTSGSSGLHIYIPLAPGTPYDAGLLFCQIIATLVATKHPGQATIERAVAARGRTVYIDYLQNVPGKTLACAYSARASEFAGVSTPLRWEEIDADVDPRAFTLANAVERTKEVGDLWAGVRSGPGVDLHDWLERYSRGSRER